MILQELALGPPDLNRGTDLPLNDGICGFHSQVWCHSCK